MKAILPLALAAAALAAAVLALALPASAQTRIEFQRQKFDRSRFAHPGTTPAPAAPAALPTPAPAPESPAAPEFPSSAAERPAYPDRPDAPPADPAAAALAELALAPKFDLVPKKWFDRARDLEEAKAIQQASGACILIYFANMNDSSQKGLCSWFEKESSSYQRWRKAMPLYIKVKITIAGGDARELAEQFRVKSTPAVFVLAPNGSYPKRVPVFEWPNGDPKPLKQDELMKNLSAVSTPAYQELL